MAVGFGSRWLDKTGSERPHFITSLNAVSGGRIVPVPGGVLVRDADNVLLGAVGFSGDSLDNDEAAAMSGIDAPGLVGQTA
ncbi:MAG: hypothetical protein EOS41_27885 [Mesorhizobium sp.]|nr:MAG: hypothetical protein EOS41_27885 [Mesorhizobium sp.]